MLACLSCNVNPCGSFLWGWAVGPGGVHVGRRRGREDGREAGGERGRQGGKEGQTEAGLS